MSQNDNYLTGKINNLKDRQRLEEWLQKLYCVHCTTNKTSPYRAIQYDYHTGLIAIGSPKRKERTALEQFVDSKGFIALFYKDKLLTIERRELI